MKRELTAAILFAAISVAVAADEPRVPQTFQEQLLQLDRMRNGTSTRFAEVEDRGLALLKTHWKPDQQALIHFQLAHIFAQSAIHLHPDRVTKYARRALAAERDPVRRGTLHTYLGNAAEVDSSILKFADRRKRAAEAYLAGYREVIELDLPAVAPELPVIEKIGGEFSGITDPAEQAELLKTHEGQIEARRKAEFTRDMVFRRDTLVRQTAELYRRAPAANDELRTLAESYLTNEKLVDELLAKVGKLE